MLKFESIAELVSEAEKQGIRISELVLKDQAEALEVTELETYEKMDRAYFNDGDGTLYSVCKCNDGWHLPVGTA